MQFWKREGKSAKDLEHDPDFVQWMESGSTMSPPEGEDGGHFMHRVCMEFETFVERMMRTGETSGCTDGTRRNHYVYFICLWIAKSAIL